MKMQETQESSQNNSGGYYHFITGTDPKYLERYAEVMVMYFGQGMSQRVIAKHLGISKSNVVGILRRYSPKKSNRNITITISSKV